MVVLRIYKNEEVAVISNLLKTMLLRPRFYVGEFAMFLRGPVDSSHMQEVTKRVESENI